MAKYIDADILRKEIEFAKSVYSNSNRVFHGVADAFRQDGRIAMCDDILKKIDSLQQEQLIIEEDWVEKRKQECGCRRLSSDGNYQCEKYEGSFGPCDERCSWIVDYPKLKKLEKQEQSEVDLDKEIDNYFYPKNFKRVNDGVEFPGWHVSDWKNPNVGKTLYTEDIRRFARHFYELKLNTRKKE